MDPHSSNCAVFNPCYSDIPVSQQSNSVPIPPPYQLKQHHLVQYNQQVGSNNYHSNNQQQLTNNKYHSNNPCIAKQQQSLDSSSSDQQRFYQNKPTKVPSGFLLSSLLSLHQYRQFQHMQNLDTDSPSPISTEGGSVSPPTPTYHTGGSPSTPTYQPQSSSRRPSNTSTNTTTLFTSNNNNQYDFNTTALDPVALAAVLTRLESCSISSTDTDCKTIDSGVSVSTQTSAVSLRNASNPGGNLQQHRPHQMPFLRAKNGAQSGSSLSRSDSSATNSLRSSVSSRDTGIGGDLGRWESPPVIDKNHNSGHPPASPIPHHHSLRLSAGTTGGSPPPPPPPYGATHNIIVASPSSQAEHDGLPSCPSAAAMTLSGTDHPAHRGNSLHNGASTSGHLPPSKLSLESAKQQRQVHLHQRRSLSPATSISSSGSSSCAITPTSSNCTNSDLPTSAVQDLSCAQSVPGNTTVSPPKLPARFPGNSSGALLNNSKCTNIQQKLVPSQPPITANKALWALQQALSGSQRPSGTALGDTRQGWSASRPSTNHDGPTKPVPGFSSNPNTGLQQQQQQVSDDGQSQVDGAPQLVQSFYVQMTLGSTTAPSESSGVKQQGPQPVAVAGNNNKAQSASLFVLLPGGPTSTPLGGNGSGSTTASSPASSSTGNSVLDSPMSSGTNQHHSNTTHHSSSGAAGGLCTECSGRINTAGEACQAMGAIYHNTCFICCCCRKLHECEGRVHTTANCFCRCRK